MRKKNERALNIEIKGPSIGLVTGAPAEQLNEKAATSARNVRFDGSVVRAAPGFAGVVLNNPLDSTPLLIHQARLSSEATPDNKLPIIGTLQKLYSVNPQAPANSPPIVNAGPDLRLDAANGLSAQLFGSATDPDGDDLTLLWTKVSGPGTVTFSDPASAFTEATVSVSGEYVLRLTANDGTNPDVFDEMTLSYVAVPIVDAGEDQTLNTGCGGTASLLGTASDPDAGPSPLSYLWTQISGPLGAVTFEDPNNLSTDVEIDEDGVFVFRLEATDGEFTVSDTVQITIVNQAPTANAGSDGSVVLDDGSATFVPSASASDPDGDDITYEWSSVGSGVSFNDNTLLQPTVTLTVEGTVTLTLTVSDGCTTTQDSVEVTVGAADDNFTDVTFDDGLRADVWSIGFITSDKGVPNLPSSWANGDAFGDTGFEATPYLRIHNTGVSPQGLVMDMTEQQLDDLGRLVLSSWYQNASVSALEYVPSIYHYPNDAFMDKWTQIDLDCEYKGLQTQSRSVGGDPPFTREQKVGSLMVDALWDTIPVFTDIQASRIRFFGHGLPSNLTFAGTSQFAATLNTLTGLSAISRVDQGDPVLSCGGGDAATTGRGWLKAKVDNTGSGTSTADEASNAEVGSAEFQADGSITVETPQETTIGGVAIVDTYTGGCGAQAATLTLRNPIGWRLVLQNELDDLWTGDPSDYIYDSIDANYYTDISDSFIGAWMANVSSNDAACKGTVSASKVRMKLPGGTAPSGFGTIEVRVYMRDVQFPVISLLGPANSIEERGPIGGQNGVLTVSKLDATTSGVGPLKPSVENTIIDTTATYDAVNNEWVTDWVSILPSITPGRQYGHAQTVAKAAWRPLIV